MNLNPFHKHSWVYNWHTVKRDNKMGWTITCEFGWCRKCGKTMKVEDK